MRLHAAAGDRSAALAQHGRCREALLRELGLAGRNAAMHPLQRPPGRRSSGC